MNNLVNIFKFLVKILKFDLNYVVVLELVQILKFGSEFVMLLQILENSPWTVDALVLTGVEFYSCNCGR